MKFTRILILTICALALQGCATYYYSSPIGDRGEYAYAGDEDYYGSGAGYATYNYSDVRYYPWWSMDYYYFGPHYYRPHYWGYASGWYSSLGFNFGYPVIYRPYGFYGPFLAAYPYMGWYDPWYGWPAYGYGANLVWYDTYWRRSYRNHVVHQYPEPGYQAYRNSRSPQTDLRRDLYTDPRDRAPAYRTGQANGVSSVSRNVSVAPSSRSGEVGMEVRNRSERKITDSHIGPAPVQSPSATSRSVRIIAAPPPARTGQAPVTSQPRMIRQVQPSQAPSRDVRPSEPPPRPVRVRPPVDPRGSDNGPGPSDRHN
jgi:hypothetical protein